MLTVHLVGFGLNWQFSITDSIHSLIDISIVNFGFNW